MKTEEQALMKELGKIKRRLALVERKAAALQKTRTTSPRAAFRRKYPRLSLDSRLFKLVGIDPLLSVEEEKKAIREAIAARFDAK